MTRIARYLTEFVGTFVFFTVIAMSGLAGAAAPLAIGGALVVMVYMGGHISGAHYNPAVSLAFFARGKLALEDLVGYWVVQLVAAICAFSFAYGITGGPVGIGPGPGVSNLKALAVEAVFTAALVLVILNVAATEETQGNSFYGLAIGFTVMAGAFAVGSISGAAFNPAVGLGATFSGAAWGEGGWSHLWIYFLAPVVGALVGAAIHSVQVAGLAEAAEPPQGRPSPGAPEPTPAA